MAKPEPTEKSNRNKAAADLRTKDLKQIEDRFRQHRKARQSQPDEAAAGRRKLVLRLGIFGVMLAVLLTLIIYPRLERQVEEEEPLPDPSPAEFLGLNARVPKGCREVKGAVYPVLRDLAPGSKFAQDNQMSFVKERRLPVEIENSIGMHFRLIPTSFGKYKMGSPPDEQGRGPDEARHDVAIRQAFYAGVHEVTQAQFEQVMGFNPSFFKGPDRPVEEVTWYQAAKFCEELSKQEELEPGAYVLPSEEEWEYLCRAGSETPYHCKDDQVLSKFAVFDANRGETVGTRRPNAWGIHNLHGNVWEWCRNFFYDYETGEKKEFRQVHAGIYYKHSIRGGNFFLAAPECRSATRNCLTGTSHGNMLGFRVLRRIRKSELVELSGDAPADTPKPDHVPAE